MRRLTEDGENVVYNTNTKLCFVCPDCGREILRTPKSFTNGIFSCRICGDGVSFPEKFFLNMLDQLDVNYIYQLDKGAFEWCKNYRYDFFLVERLRHLLFSKRLVI